MPIEQQHQKPPTGFTMPNQINPMKQTLTTALICGFALSAFAQGKSNSSPMELDVLKASLGVWDAEIEVWPDGPESASIKFKGVETNRPYGKHWLASDFDSEFMGQTIKVHSIIGYDLDQKKLVGKVIDDGPYAASMTGEYDHDARTVTWMTQAKAANGKPIVQKTTVTQKTDNERTLVLSVPGKQKDAFTRFMQIKFTKRQ